MKTSLTIHFDTPADLAAFNAKMFGAESTPAATAPATTTAPAADDLLGGAATAPEPVSIDTMVALAKKLAGEPGKLESIKAVCQKYGITKLTDCPAEKVQPIYAELLAL